MTAATANLSGTHLYAGEGTYKGRDVHVIAYQNEASSSGPNAMIIPFPTSEAMGPENIIDTSMFPTFLKSITEPLQQRTRSALNSTKSVHKGYQVFDVGSYTVVLATQISSVTEALAEVSLNRRPTVSASFIEGFAALYPDWPVALCCWNGDIKPEPLLWWYIPRDFSQIFAPSMDAHDGGPPKLNTDVLVDHWVAFGSTKVPMGARVYYNHTVFPENVRGLLPTQIKGRHIQRIMPNEDFYVSRESLHSAKTVVTRADRPVDLMF